LSELEIGLTTQEDFTPQEIFPITAPPEGELSLEESSTKAVPQIELTPIQAETIKRVKQESISNYEAFVDSEELRQRVTESVHAAAELYVLTELDPQLGPQIEELVPDYKDFQRGTPGDDENKLAAVHSSMSTESANREIQKERKRESFIRDLFILGSMVDKDGELVSKTEFRKKVTEKASSISEGLLRNAKILTEQDSTEQPQIVITVRKATMEEFLRSGEYRTQLDKTKFSKEMEEDIEEVARMSEESPAYSAKWTALGGLGKRKARQIYLGIDGKPNPVYGEIIVDPQLELKELANRGYGQIHLILRPEVQERTVFATGDTVAERDVNKQLSWEEGIKAKKFLNTFKKQSPFVDWRKIPEYVEAHILGGVSMNDIDECLLRDSEENSKILEYFRSFPEKFKVQADEGNLVRVEFLRNLK